MSKETVPQSLDFTIILQFYAFKTISVNVWAVDTTSSYTYIVCTTAILYIYTLLMQLSQDNFSLDMESARLSI